MCKPQYCSNRHGNPNKQTNSHSHNTHNTSNTHPCLQPHTRFRWLLIPLVGTVRPCCRNRLLGRYGHAVIRFSSTSISSSTGSQRLLTPPPPAAVLLPPHPRTTNKEHKQHQILHPHSPRQLLYCPALNPVPDVAGRRICWSRQQWSCRTEMITQSMASLS